MFVGRRSLGEALETMGRDYSLNDAETKISMRIAGRMSKKLLFCDAGKVNDWKPRLALFLGRLGGSSLFLPLSCWSNATNFREVENVIHAFVVSIRHRGHRIITYVSNSVLPAKVTVRLISRWKAVNSVSCRSSAPARTPCRGDLNS